MARAIDKRIMLDLIIEAKKTDPETCPFSEWLAEYLVDHLPTLTPQNEWVSVGDRLPGELKMVLVYCGGLYAVAGWVKDEEDKICWTCKTEPEFWRPIPELDG